MSSRRFSLAFDPAAVLCLQSGGDFPLLRHRQTAVPILPQDGGLFRFYITGTSSS